MNDMNRTEDTDMSGYHMDMAVANDNVTAESRIGIGTGTEPGTPRAGMGMAQAACLGGMRFPDGCIISDPKGEL